MKRYFTVLLLMLMAGATRAQVVKMDINNISAPIIPKGLFFRDTGNTDVFETLKDSATSTIYASNLWFSGIRPSDSLLKFSYSRYNDTNYFNAYSTGPLSVVAGSGGGLKRDYGLGTNTTLQQNNWNKVFVVYKSQIDVFKTWFDCLMDPLCDTSVAYPGYRIPQELLDWPAHGDVSLDEDYNLSPFIDYNLDGIYDPNDGDYPCIKGDKYAKIIMNDLGDLNIYARQTIGVEIHVGVYAYDTFALHPLANTIFVEYDIINRSTDSLVDVVTSAYADFDIGCSSDDYVGTFPGLNTIFAYNADQIDDNCYLHQNPFDTIPPAQGITVLNHSLSGSMYYTGTNSFISGEPSNGISVRNYQQNKWLNGQPLVVGYTGVPGYSGATTTNAQFAFPQDTIIGGQMWTEVNSTPSSANPSGSRKMLANVNHTVFAPGDVIELDLAYVYSRSDTGTNLTSIDKLKTDVSYIQWFYNNLNPSNCYISSGGPLSLEELTANMLTIFPNPSNGLVNIKIDESVEVSRIEILDLSGKVIDVIKPTTNSIQLDNLSRGAYLVKMVDIKQRQLVKRLIRN